MTRKKQVRTVIFDTVKKQKGLSLGIVSAVIGAVVFALIPPLILADIVDSITAGTDAAFARILLYFAMLALTGFTESARESLLVVFGQKITHALRSSLMDKFTHLTADNMTKQEPGTLVSRFVGDVDTVETLFSSGIISMFADACRIISILVVIWFQNRGLAIVLPVLLPFLFCFTRHVQKNMLAAQIENRKAVGRASGHVPETLHNIRTIHCLGKEKYMEKRYDTYINESYRAMEKTNFYDAVYSPVILITNAVVVAVVMLLSASGNTTVLTLFGMSAGTAVALSTTFRRSSRRLKALAWRFKPSSPRWRASTASTSSSRWKKIPIPYRHMSRRPSPQEVKACRLSSSAMSRSATISAWCWIT